MSNAPSEVVQRKDRKAEQDSSFVRNRVRFGEVRNGAERQVITASAAREWHYVVHEAINGTNNYDGPKQQQQNGRGGQNKLEWAKILVLLMMTS